ncbi:MAG: T9SS type A sorting domain-containing protein [Ferruginibacter sp.]
MKYIVIVFFFLSLILFAKAQAPAIVKAVTGAVTEPKNKDQEGWKNSEWNGLFFYQGTGSGVKLCVTDGTSDGTVFLADLGTSQTLLSTIPAQSFIYIITTRIVSISPFTTEKQIWRSDGTTAGTSLVFTTVPTPTSVTTVFTSDRDAQKNFSVTGNVMYFGGYDATNGNELWVTDGTAAGTHIVLDIKPGSGNSSPQAFCKIGSDVFFTATAVGFERKLWKTDGTGAGTVQIPVAEPFFILDNAVGIVNNKMIFYAHNTVDGYEPYVSDGTASGTFMLANINPSGNSWITQSQNAHLRFTSKNCFFIANNGTANALWGTDGTSAGTIQLTTNAQAAWSGVSGGSYTETDENGLWMIEYNSGGSGNNEKLYRSDGTVAGTYLAATSLSYAQYVKSYKGGLWMAGRNTGSAANVEPWRSGGNAATTKKAFEIEPGNSGSPTFTPLSSSPYGFFVKNGKLYFFASTSIPSAHNLYQYTGDFTFNGTVTGGNWKDSANWNGLMPPGITDSVYVNAGTPNALNITTTNAYAGTLLLGNNAVVNIAAGTDSLIINTRVAPAGNNSFTGNGVLALRNIFADTVEINNGFSTANVALQSHASVAAGTVSVSTNLNLTNSSQLMVNNSGIVLTGSTSTITQTGNSYINTNGTGKLTIENIGIAERSGAVNFPVGTSAYYNPVLITNSSMADNFSIRVQPQIFAAYTGENGTGTYTANAVDATWFITEANAGGSNADIILQWNQLQELPGFDRTTSRFGHYNGGSWQLGTAATAAGSNPYTFTGTGITSFSPFGILNNAGALPLQFILFTAQKCNDNNVCLNWQTANEINVSHFMIERSPDGQLYTPVATITAQNRLSNNYNYTNDITSLQYSNKIYYRIKQVDKDGRFTRSNIVFVTNTSDVAISVYPNPAVNALYIHGWEKAAVFEVFTLAGNKMITTKPSPYINVTGLTSGVYLLKVIDKNGTTTSLKFNKQ